LTNLFSNLDAKLRRQVREDIREIQQKLGVTTIYVTHDQEEALAISDKVIVMNKAVIAQEGSPKDLYNFPKNKLLLISLVTQMTSLQK
jgi:iron(III) transport system ATP-binding protein